MTTKIIYGLALMKVLNADNENFEFTFVGEGNSDASAQDQMEDEEMQVEEWLQREKDKVHAAARSGAERS